MRRVAEWTNETDITKDHEAATAKASEIASVEITKMVKEARKFDPIIDKLDPDTKRQLLLLKFQATAVARRSEASDRARADRRRR